MYRNTVAAEEYIRLRKSHKKLLNSLDVKSDLLSSLYQEGVISEDDMERINAKDTSKDKAEQLILMIQKKCISGARPYANFLTALDECDQAHLSKIVTSQSVKDRDYETFKDAFMPQSGASSTAPGSPRRSFYQPTVSSQTKMIKEHVNKMLSQPNLDNDSGNANIPSVSFHVPKSHGGDDFSTQGPGYEDSGGHPVPHNNNDYGYDTSILRSPPRHNGHYPCHRNQTQSINAFYLSQGDVSDISHDEGENNVVKRSGKSKQFPHYEPSYKNSPHRKIYKIDNVKNCHTGFPSSQTFAWTCNNTEGCRYSSGLAFSVIAGNPSDTVYQSLDSVRSFSPSKSTVVQKKRPNRDSGMTDREQHLEVQDEDDDDNVVYNEPSDQIPTAAAQYADHSQNGGSYICLNCQMIYGTNNIGASALSPRSESDAHSTDIMNASSDRFLTTNRRSNSECCIIL